MRYNSIEELNQEYKTSREDMSFEEEVEFVQDCFDTFEGIGFSEVFHTTFSDYADKNGEPFKVLRRLSYVDGDADLECLPMWHISFDDGTEIDAYPEEICR